MAKPIEPDQILLKMPSLRAVKSFVAAAKYLNFTRAAEALCVTQAAISRQIRELEVALGVPLFKRTGRAVELTEAGQIFYDAAYLSFVNIAQAAQRIQSSANKKKELSICCTPAFSSFWLTNRLPDFVKRYPDIDINVISTSSMLHTEPGVYPDIFISKLSDPREGYHSEPLFHDLIYPVCSPSYLEAHPELGRFINIDDVTLLNLTPYGRSQVAEHVDWDVWLNSLGIGSEATGQVHYFNTNDYNMLIQLAVSGQGVCLGWHHLVAPLIDQGALVRAGEMEITYREKKHYLSYAERNEGKEALQVFRNWFIDDIERNLSNLF